MHDLKHKILAFDTIAIIQSWTMWANQLCIDLKHDIMFLMTASLAMQDLK